MMIATSEDDNDGNGAMGDEVDDDGNGATGDGATGYDDNDNDGGGTTGDEVDDYGEGATGDDNNDDDGDGTERRNNQIEATAAAGGNIAIGIQRRKATTMRTITTAPARIARRECGRSIG